MADALGRLAPGVRGVFAAVVLVPLLGLGWLAANDVRAASAEVERTARIAFLASRLDDAIQAEALIDAESYWAQALASINEFNIPLPAITQLSGIDLEASYSETQQRVDQLLASRPLPPELSTQLADAREQIQPGVTNTAIQEAYAKVEASITVSIRSDMAEIRSLAGSVQDTSELASSIGILDLSVELRDSVSNMTEAYFGSRFPIGDAAANEAVALLEHRLVYDRDLELLHDLVPSGSELESLWDQVASDEAVTTFFGRVESLNDLVKSEGTGDDALSSAVTFADIPEEGRAFIGSLEAVDRHVNFVQAVSKDVVQRSVVISVNAENSRKNVFIATMGLGALALVAVGAASLWIVGPLRRMAVVVAQLRDGELGGSVNEAGPTEVRAAARALNEAVDNMNVAERMSKALADRDLNSPAFEVETTGRLGSSLRDAMSALAGSIAEREEFRERLAYEATHDGLTGLANRADTMARLEAALGRFRRSDHELAVLFIDLDGFKQVNDAHGHAAGDQLLSTMAKRLAKATRIGDHVGRIGGDEFVVIAEPVDGLDNAMELAARVLQSIAEPLTINGLTLSITASIGVAFASSESTPEDLLRDADLALYEAKGDGKARSKFCDEDLKTHQQERLTIGKALELALDTDVLELHFQPIVDALTGELSSVEALLRWPQPSGVFVPPAVFIPVAERSDLILDVDRWVLKAIARQLSEWTDVSGLQAVTASVNISARHLSNPALFDEVMEPLRSWGVDPSRLVVEITETALLDDIEQAATTLGRLRSESVKIAIDDFGTGYASLAHLRRLPVDILKIDKSFVAGLDRVDDSSLVQLTIDTGHLLGASITAEGVETDEQARRLTLMGTDLLQGFGLGRPMPPEQLSGWLLEHRSTTLIA